MKVYLFISNHKKLLKMYLPYIEALNKMAYDDRDYYGNAGGVVTADQPQSSVLSAGAWHQDEPASTGGKEHERIETKNKRKRN